eukprot:TRINITY_DN66190_c0_g1_i1.p1 TRINITY_DN66190_c0_g1~~TRINITY_DN66190_c0_g1_i1.p1  ORF type:complete len:256 (-),score=48.04 TRINITY_DN66190_c0_g1_i1:271-972(-)
MSVADILGPGADRWCSWGPAERTAFVNKWLPRINMAAADWNNLSEIDKLYVLREFFQVDLQVLEVMGPCAAWWHNLSEEQKRDHIVAAKLDHRAWGQLSVSQRSTLVQEFKKLDESRSELRALQDPTFSRTMARLRGLSVALEHDAWRSMSLPGGIRDVFHGMTDDRAACGPQLAAAPAITAAPTAAAASTTTEALATTAAPTTTEALTTTVAPTTTEDLTAAAAATTTDYSS